MNDSECFYSLFAPLSVSLGHSEAFGARLVQSVSMTVFRMSLTLPILISSAKNPPPISLSVFRHQYIE